MMRDTLISVFTEDKKSKVLEMLKDSIIEANTQHIIFKKGLFIDFPKDCDNIIVIEVEKEVYHVSLENIFRISETGNNKYIVVSIEEEKLNLDEFVRFQSKLAVRGICPIEWGGVATFFNVTEREEILNRLLMEIKNEN